MSNTHQRSARKPARVLRVATRVMATVTMIAAITSGWRAPRRARGAGNGRGPLATGGNAGGGSGWAGGWAAEGVGVAAEEGVAPVTIDQRRTAPTSLPFGPGSA